MVEGSPELVHLLLADALGIPGQDLVLHLIDGPGDGGEELLPAHADVLGVGRACQQRGPRPGPPLLLLPLTIKMAKAIEPGLLSRFTVSPEAGGPGQGQPTRTEDPDDEGGSTGGWWPLPGMAETRMTSVVRSGRRAKLAAGKTKGQKSG